MSDNDGPRNRKLCNSVPSSPLFAPPRSSSIPLTKVTRPSVSGAPDVAGDSEHRETDTASHRPDHPDPESLRTGTPGGPAESTMGSTPPPSRKSPYVMVDGGFGRVEVTGKGSRTIRLSNFFAWISEQVSRDDGTTRTTCYRIKGIMWDGTPLQAEIAQQDFKAMRWVEAHFGLDAMIYPGKSSAQHVYSAIKFFSHDRKSRTVYFHTGWKRIQDRWLFLHGDGAIDPARVAPAAPRGRRRGRGPANG